MDTERIENKLVGKKEQKEEEKEMPLEAPTGDLPGSAKPTEEAKEGTIPPKEPSSPEPKKPKDDKSKKKTLRTRFTYEELLGKDSDEYQAAVIGDQVGDPMKATSGPAISELMKQSCMLALIFGEFFASIALIKV